MAIGVLAAQLGGAVGEQGDGAAVGGGQAGGQAAGRHADEGQRRGEGAGAVRAVAAAGAEQGGQATADGGGDLGEVAVVVVDVAVGGFAGGVVVAVAGGLVELNGQRRGAGRHGLPRPVVLEVDMAADIGLLAHLAAEADVAEVEGVVGLAAGADVLHAEAIELASVVAVDDADVELDAIVHQQTLDDHAVIVIVGVTDGVSNPRIGVIGNAVGTIPGADQGVAEPYLDGHDGLRGRGLADGAVGVVGAQFARVEGEDLGAYPVRVIAPSLHQGEAAAGALHSFGEIDRRDRLGVRILRRCLVLHEVDHNAIADGDRLAVAADGKVAGIDGVATEIQAGEQQLDAGGGICHRVPQVLPGCGRGEVVEGDVLDGIDEHQAGEVDGLVEGAVIGMLDRFVLDDGDSRAAGVADGRCYLLQDQREGDPLIRSSPVGIAENGGVVDPDQGDGVAAGGRAQGAQHLGNHGVAILQGELQVRVHIGLEGQHPVLRRLDGVAGGGGAQGVQGAEQRGDGAQQYVVVVIVLGGRGDAAGLQPLAFVDGDVFGEGLVENGAHGQAPAR
ncbi:hypothetical protein E0E53_01910 [Azotobacter chroococcum]|nr:hypothetical protein E0E53_01910 [Azotobacter chroococcum]